MRKHFYQWTTLTEAGPLIIFLNNLILDLII